MMKLCEEEEEAPIWMVIHQVTLVSLNPFGSSLERSHILAYNEIKTYEAKLLWIIPYISSSFSFWSIPYISFVIMEFILIFKGKHCLFFFERRQTLSIVYTWKFKLITFWMDIIETKSPLSLSIVSTNPSTGPN